MIDYVFPVMAIAHTGPQAIDYRGLLGTGFLVKGGHPVHGMTVTG